MYERLVLCKELLSDTGSIYLHCDWHRSHYLRMLLEDVFGNNRFVNEIIWNYESGGIPETFFSRKHDNIFFISKTDKYIFNKKNVLVPRNICQSCGSEMQKWNNLKKEIDENGKTYRTIKSNGKIYKYYDDEPILLSDVWLDINHLQQKDPQRLDYPTQKPEKLLERIIKASSNPGDIVFDCFMGSGTTQAVAMKLGRKFLGADINLGAIQTTTKRLINRAKELESELTDETKYTGFEVYNVNDYDFFRNELEAKRLIIEALGMQPLPENNLWDAELDGRMVSILGINRIATASEFEKIIANIDIADWQKKQSENPGKPVEAITFVCMGHDPNLKAMFDQKMASLGFKVDLQIVDILRDKKDLTFKRDSDAKIIIKKGQLVVEQFYPMNLLQKLSIAKKDISDWKELVDSIMIDWNYDGVTFSPVTTDIPEKNEMVKGTYKVSQGAGTIHIKITDLISESWEGNVQ